ncbi:radical SAM protein [Clostridioides difficile]|nr:radical SAM protein [Clostridioides difficile]
MKFTIFVTEDCNLRCTYCYEGNDKKKENMSYETADKTIDFICNKELESNSDYTTIDLHGGEPFINIDLIKYIHRDLVDRLSDKKILFDITTNGTIINDEIIEFIAKNVKNISISIDGKKNIHDINRIDANGVGTYEKVMENGKRLIDKGIYVRARMTYNSNTVKYLYESVYDIAKQGFKNIAPISDFMDKNWDNSHIKILNEQISKIMNIKKDYPDIDISILDKQFINKKKGDCFGGINSYAIDTRGDVYPCTVCVGDKDILLGNIYDGLDDKKIKNLIKIYISKNEECDGCTRLDYCMSTRCKLINKKVTGKFQSAVPIYCGLERVYVETTKKLCSL